MAAIEEDRRLAVGRGKLQPAGRGLVGRLHLGDDAGKRAVAQGIFGHGKDGAVSRALRIEKLLRA